MIHHENMVQQALWQEGKCGTMGSRCKQERYLRMVVHRDMCQRKRTEQEKKKEQKRQKRHLSLRLAMQQSWREQELWYLQQPDRRCSTCSQIKPASTFGGTCNAYGFTPHTRCQPCQDALHERKQLSCCLCQQKTSHHDFLSQLNGYTLRGGGTWIALCCKDCEAAFLALPEVRQRMFIHSCCQRAFPAGQVIYCEIDPETQAIRYIGRTSKPATRHGEHLRNISPQLALWGSERKAWYTRRNWMQDLSDKGLTPSMKVLLTVKTSPLVVEWEQRYIWHGIQQGWNLLNVEIMDEALISRVKAAHVDFLTVPFATLVQHHFFAAHGLEAFLHEYDQSEYTLR